MSRPNRLRTNIADTDIDALHRGGQVRSSVEAAVMAAERRGLVIQLPTVDQLFITGGVVEGSRTIWCISMWFE
ncbi:MAG: hypothetical protein ACYS3N_24415 [Planctomycetota bacterium]